jgi:hypothetical protein
MTQLYIGQGCVSFICDTQRDVHDKKPISQIKRTLRDLAELQGSDAFVLVRKELDGRISSVLSDKPGYSLGESVWTTLKRQGYKKDANLIWCEQIPADAQSDNADALLVIIAQGQVIYDARIPPSVLDKSAANLLDQAADQYDIMVFGDTPIIDPSQQTDTIGNIRIRSELISKYKVLGQSLLPDLVPIKRHALVPIANAFVNAKLTQRWVKPTILAAAFVFSAIAGYQFINQPSHSPNQTPKVIIDRYEDFKQALEAPLPSSVMNKLMEISLSLHGLSGANLQETTFNAGVLTAYLSISDPVFLPLSDRLEKQGWMTKYEEGVLVISQPIELPGRQKPKGIMSANNVLNSLLDTAFYVGAKIQIEQPQTNAAFTTTQVTILFKDASFMLTQYMAAALAPYPIVIDHLSFQHSSPYQADVQINLTVYGDSA